MRLSSMGDVLLTLPVITGILAGNPEVQIIFVTRSRFVPYFAGIPRLTVIAFDPEGHHKGLIGIIRLFKEIRRHDFKTVIDLHGILRTWILDAFFLLTGSAIFTVRKYRKLRRFILKNPKAGKSVPHTVSRYSAVFKKAGLICQISASVFPAPPDPSQVETGHKNPIKIGIAPMSKHSTKNWGISNVSELISLAKTKYDAEIHLFGGLEDKLILDTLSGPKIYNHAGMSNPMDEISLIRTMTLFVSMDSANMHLASLVGIPTISIWGATDPSLGFAPLFQPEAYTLHSDSPDVYCRPCSVYGELPCKRIDAPMLCMTSIRPGQVLNKINEILN